MPLHLPAGNPLVEQWVQHPCPGSEAIQVHKYGMYQRVGYPRVVLLVQHQKVGTVAAGAIGVHAHKRSPYLGYPFAGLHVGSTKNGNAAMNSSKRLGVATMNHCWIDPIPTIGVGAVRAALGPTLGEDDMEGVG